ncbi:hypothetical protein ACFO3O_02355 [Dokdonia ponticola]|uniref:Uncharacterized protein n=1 Tax=Dokdonia ponticola TaxID=2041041 RepID=A0ABV9HS84_9FLAO
MYKRYLYLKQISTFLFLILVGVSGDLLSQTRYTVVLPEIDTAIPPRDDKNLEVSADNSGDETAKSFFKFDLNHLPQFTKAKAYYLRMYTVPNDNTSDFSTQTITVLKGPNTWTGKETSLSNPALDWAIKTKNTKTIGRDEVKKSSTVINMKLNPRALEAIPDNILSLATRSPEKRQKTLFYSSITSQKPGLFSKRPKLILRYEVDPFPFRSDWAQPFSTAQHDSYLNWSTNTTITKPSVRILPNASKDVLVGGDPTGAVAIYKNQPIIFTQAASGNTPFKVKQLNARGDVLWTQAVDNMIKSRPLIDELGRLYYFSTSNTLTILDLTNSGAVLYKKSLSEITNNQITSIHSDVTLGYDGTLYLTSFDGIVALSAYPQLKLRWKYEKEKDKRNGPISLSQDESLAFFINVDTQQGTSRLVMLDNTDGRILDASESLLGGYKNGNNYYIPAPVVQKNKKVFVLNGYDSANRLLVFDIKSESLKGPETIRSGQSVNTGISQPAIDGDENVFFVFNKKIARYNTKEANHVEVFENSEVLDNAPIIVTDHSSNIYVSNPYVVNDTLTKTSKRVVGFTYDKKFTYNFTAAIDTNIRKTLVLAPDGTLYTITANNVIAITAKEVNEANITLSSLNTNTVYRATNRIRLTDFSVLPTVNTILYSGGGMGLQPGFRVRKGASVTFKTGN